MNRSPLDHEVVPTPGHFECIADIGLNVGESPIWSFAESCLYFIDIGGAKLFRLQPSDGDLAVVQLSDMVTAIAPRAKGGLVFAQERSFAFFDMPTQKRVTVATANREPVGNRFNDGKCDRLGRFWAGTMDKTTWDAPSGTLYTLDATGVIREVLHGIRCSNGLAWSPDNRVFYYVESFAHCIHAFNHDPETGALSGGRLFARLDHASGAFPDGLTVDAQGCVWSAQPVYGRLVRYTPDGSIDRIIETPVSRPTSCIFGGPDLSTLYVTSARDSLTPEQLREEPLAGGVFAFRPGVAGLPETPFAG